MSLEVGIAGESGRVDQQCPPGGGSLAVRGFRASPPPAGSRSLSRSPSPKPPRLPPLEEAARAARKAVRIAGEDPQDGDGGGAKRRLLAELERRTDERTEQYLGVCAQCRAALLRSFEHCLCAREAEQSQEAKPLPSSNDIDEEEDGQRKHPPPPYQLIADPSQKFAKATIVVDPAEEAVREREVYVEGKASDRQIRDSVVRDGVSKAAAACELAAVAAASAFARENWASKSHPEAHVSFSGAVFRQMLQAKDRELDKLRTLLYQKAASENRDKEEKTQLQLALKKSMKYYVNAEQWQTLESEQLKQDIKHLKAEISSLMAAMIKNSMENQQRELATQEYRKELAAKDEKYRQLEVEYAKLKDRLHGQLKDYINVNKMIDDLKREAKRGSEVVQDRNGFLQQNLDKVTAEFEAVSKRMQTFEDRSATLEVELNEITAQFEIVSEQKLSVERVVDVLRQDLERTSAKLTDVTGKLGVVSLQHSQVADELKEMTKLHIDSEYDFHEKLTAVTKELSEVYAAKNEIEATAQALAEDKRVLQADVSEANKARSAVEEQMRSAASKAERDIKAKEAHITMLQKELLEQKELAKNHFDARNKVMSQINDLKNLLDREQTAHNMVQVELAEARRSTAEKIADFEDNITRLSAAKVNLINDKKALMEAMKDLREQLKGKEEALAALDAKFKDFLAESAQKQAALEAKLRNAQEAYKQLAEQHNTLKTKYAGLVKTSTDLNAAYKRSLAEVEGLKNEKEGHLEDIRRLQGVRIGLEGDIARLEQANVNANKAVEAGKARTSELEQAARVAAQDSASAVAALKEVIRQKIDRIEELRRDTALADERLRTVILRFGRLQRDYNISQELLRQESAARSSIELNLDELRSAYQSERKMRLEYERTEARLRRITDAKERAIAADAKARERKMALLDETLNREHVRLQAIAKIIESAG